MLQTLKIQLNNFIDKCIPLSIDDKFSYFVSETGEFYGYEVEKNILFEPNSTTKNKILKQCFEKQFDDSVKHQLETLAHLRFSDLIELNIKLNYKDKYLGRIFFYYKKTSMIYGWSLLTKTWEKKHSDEMRSIFSNTELFLDNMDSNDNARKSEKARTLHDMGIDFNDLEEISIRLRDGSIHYYHPALNRIVSMNMFDSRWYSPSPNVQSMLLKHVNDTKIVDLDVKKSSDRQSTPEEQHI